MPSPNAWTRHRERLTMPRCKRKGMCVWRLSNTP